MQSFHDTYSHCAIMTSTCSNFLEQAWSSPVTLDESIILRMLFFSSNFFFYLSFVHSVFFYFLFIADYQVKWGVFKIYLKNLGLFYSILILMLHPLAHLAQFGTNLWLADWSEDAKNEKNATLIIRNNPYILYNLSAYPEVQKDLDFLQSQRNYRLGVYGALGFVQCKICFQTHDFYF